MLFAVAPIAAQEPEAAPAEEEDYILLEEELEIAERLEEYVDEYNTLTLEISLTPSESLDALGKQADVVGRKANLYLQSKLEAISLSDTLLSLTAEVQALNQMVADSIESQKVKLKAISEFKKAQNVIAMSDTLFNSLLDKAEKYSYTEQTADQLAEVQSKSQLEFQSIQELYQNAAGALAFMPSLERRYEEMKTRFLKLQKLNDDIQKTAYKPLIERVKDWLLGIAAVSIILMFINMVVSKIQAIQKMKESAKKAKELLERQSSDIPEI